MNSEINALLKDLFQQNINYHLAQMTVDKTGASVAVSNMAWVQNKLDAEAKRLAAQRTTIESE